MFTYASEFSKVILGYQLSNQMPFQGVEVKGDASGLRPPLMVNILVWTPLCGCGHPWCGCGRVCLQLVSSALGPSLVLPCSGCDPDGRGMFLGCDQ